MLTDAAPYFSLTCVSYLFCRTWGTYALLWSRKATAGEICLTSCSAMHFPCHLTRWDSLSLWIIKASCPQYITTCANTRLIGWIYIRFIIFNYDGIYGVFFLFWWKYVWGQIQTPSPKPSAHSWPCVTLSTESVCVLKPGDVWREWLGYLWPSARVQQAGEWPAPLAKWIGQLH